MSEDNFEEEDYEEYGEGQADDSLTPPEITIERPSSFNSQRLQQNYPADAGPEEEEWEQDENEYRYSIGESQKDDGQYNQDNSMYYYDDDQNADQDTGGGQSYDQTQSYDVDYYYDDDDWPSYLNDTTDGGTVGDDKTLDSQEYEGDETIAGNNSPEKSLERSPGKEGKDDESPKQRKANAPPVELGKRSFRWFERKILGHQFPPSEENLRRKQILEKCQMVRKVSKPVVTLLEAKEKPIRSTDSGNKVPGVVLRKESQESFVEGEEDGTERSKTFRDYSEKEWAIKNTIDFLSSQGCTSSSSRSYKSSLRAPSKEPDFRLNLYETQLQRRRQGIGHGQAAPEITDALKRAAERTVWRAVIDNTKPRYHLPRFILPRHKYLKKIQAQFIGPGSYEMDIFEKSMKARKMGLPSTWATCTSRFPKDGGGDEDGGGKGLRNAGGTVLLDPWTALDKANHKHKYPGTYIPFESTPKNFRKGLMETGSRVPPNAYNLKSPLEEYIKKKTSLRGPYDCYTPPRGVIPYGYHKSQNTEEKGRLGPGAYEIRTSVVKEFNDPYNYFKSVFGKADRNKMFGFKACFDNPLWPRDDGFAPAVGQYDPDTYVIGQDQEQNMAPFKTQAGLKKREVKNPDLVSPDYYYFASGCSWTVPPKGANLASVFKSKSPQIMPPIMHKVAKERRKATNRKFDLERLDEGYLLEEHYAYDTPVRNTYVLEDCKDPTLMPKGGPKLDLFAIPGTGIAGCCGAGADVVKRAGGCGC